MSLRVSGGIPPLRIASTPLSCHWEREQQEVSQISQIFCVGDQCPLCGKPSSRTFIKQERIIKLKTRNIQKPIRRRPEFQLNFCHCTHTGLASPAVDAKPLLNPGKWHKGLTSYSRAERAWTHIRTLRCVPQHIRLRWFPQGPVAPS